MSPKISAEVILNAVGGGFLALGFGLGLLFGTIDVPVEGPAGIAVAILFGFGLCILLFAALRRVIFVSDPRKSKADDLLESERPGRFADLKVRSTKLAIRFTAITTAIAVALFFGGIPVAFLGFNFASGTNDVGLIMIFTGMVVGAISIVSGFVAILLGGSVLCTSGKVYWLFVSLAVPIFQVIAYLVGRYVTK